MIIFGTRGVTYNAATGDFYCPACQGDGGYKHKRVRRFFTLYFIPVIPMNLHGEYVECERCKNAYHLDVLQFDPKAQAAEFEAEFHKAIKRVAVQMMLADGVVDDDEIRVIQEVYAELTGSQLGHDAVQAEIASVELEGGDVRHTLARFAGNLNEHGKEMVVRAAFMVAAADGEFEESEKQMLSEIAEVLGMSMAHLQGVVQSVMNEGQDQPL